MNNKHKQMYNEAMADIRTALENGYNGYYCDLHNEVFNTDYYIIGRAEAKEALNEYDVFEAIDLVQEYERDNFGEVLTDLSSPEKLINMVYYIIGEEAVAWVCLKIPTFNVNWNKEATEETNMLILSAMAKLEA